jgi:hypothetical protein
MRIYIASHDRWAALHVAGALVEAGHEIVSRWINKPFHPTEHHAAGEREIIGKWLKANGYDGLWLDDIGDPCEALNLDYCKAAIKDDVGLYGPKEGE